MAGIATTAAAPAPEPWRGELTAAERERDSARLSYLASGAVTDPEAGALARARLERAKRAVADAERAHAERAALPVTPDSLHATTRGAAAEARRRWAADWRPVYMVAEGRGVRLTAWPPASGPFAVMELAYSKGPRPDAWGVYRWGPGGIPSRTDVPFISELRSDRTTEGR